MSDAPKGCVIELPEGIDPSTVEFVAGSMEFVFESIPGTSFLKLVLVDGIFHPFSKNV